MVDLDWMAEVCMFCICVMAVFILLMLVLRSLFVSSELSSVPLGAFLPFTFFVDFNGAEVGLIFFLTSFQSSAISMILYLNDRIYIN